MTDADGVRAGRESWKEAGATTNRPCSSKLTRRAAKTRESLHACTQHKRGQSKQDKMTCRLNFSTAASSSLDLWRLAGAASRTRARGGARRGRQRKKPPSAKKVAGDPGGRRQRTNGITEAEHRSAAEIDLLILTRGQLRPW